MWAVGLYSGNDETGFEHNSTYAMMNICVELTDEGFANLEEVGEFRNVFSLCTEYQICKFCISLFFFCRLCV